MEQILDFINNHWDLFAALIIILALLFASTLVNAIRGIKQIGPAEATHLINHQDALVLDVREDKEFAGGHIINSMHIPMAEVQNKLAGLSKYKTSPVIVSCRSGARSNSICGMLRKNGFENVANLKGGVMAWQNANMPLNKK